MTRLTRSIFPFEKSTEGEKSSKDALRTHKQDDAPFCEIAAELGRFAMNKLQSWLTQASPLVPFLASPGRLMLPWDDFLVLGAGETLELQSVVSSVPLSALFPFLARCVLCCASFSSVLTIRHRQTATAGSDVQGATWVDV